MTDCFKGFLPRIGSDEKGTREDQVFQGVQTRDDGGERGINEAATEREL